MEHADLAWTNVQQQSMAWKLLNCPDCKCHTVPQAVGAKALQRSIRRSGNSYDLFSTNAVSCNCGGTWIMCHSSNSSKISSRSILQKQCGCVGCGALFSLKPCPHLTNQILEYKPESHLTCCFFNEDFTHDERTPLSSAFTEHITDFKE